MTYTIEIIDDLRARLFEEALLEYRLQTDNVSAPRSGVSLALVEQRLQTLIMAGIGDPSNTERKTSPEMAALASRYMEHEDDNVRSLAASVLSQA